MSNAWVICLRNGDNVPKGVLIPDDIILTLVEMIKGGLLKKLPFGDKPAYH